MKRFLIGILLLSVTLSTFSKDNQYSGWINIGGTKIDFIIEFDIAKNNLISGTSITAKGTSDETICRIKGRYTPRTGAIHFYETVVISSKAKRENLNFCLLNATMKKNETNTLIRYSGMVTGYIRGSKTVCGKGSILVEMKKPTAVPPKKVEPKKVVEPNKVIVTDTLYSNVNSKKIVAYTMTGTTVSLDIRDDIKADGDVVNIYFDGKPVLLNYTLTEQFKTIELSTANTSKKHIVKIVAQNEGMASPNTSRIVLKSQTVTKELTAHIKKGQAVYIEIAQ